MKYYSSGDGDGGAAVLNNYIKIQTFILHELIQSRIGRYIAPIINNRFLEHGWICISITFFSFQMKETRSVSLIFFTIG